MDSLLSFLLLSPVGLAANSIASTYTWLTNCFGGVCGVTPSSVTEMFTGIGSSLGSTVSYLGSTLGSLLLGIFSYLPQGGGFPTIFHTAAQSFGSTLSSVDFIFPASALVYCLTLILSVKLALWSFHLIRVGVSFVRGVAVDNFKG